MINMDETKLLNILKKYYAFEIDDPTEIDSIKDLVVAIRKNIHLSHYPMSEDYLRLVDYLDGVEEVSEEEHIYMFMQIRKGCELIKDIEKREREIEADERRPFRIYSVMGETVGDMERIEKMFGHKHPYSDEVVKEFERIQKEVKNISKSISEEYFKVYK